MQIFVNKKILKAALKYKAIRKRKVCKLKTNKFQNKPEFSKK